MPTFTVRGRITRDRRLEVQLPPEAPEGEAEVTVLVRDTSVPPLGSPERLAAVLEEIRRSYPGSGRTRDEIDSYLAAERASWDDDE
ncbi:MAG: hypothetical protein ACKVT1_10060 [Dehalococcoidia bacterium]